MAKISTDAYKGVRDFYPEDQALFKWITEKMHRASESFGFVEYHASILEPSELYKGKTSEEIVNEQTYSFIDRGEREVTLRPEMTPTVARMVAARRRELSFPLRWYSIPNVFRYERPQRGRLREHWQLNCDIFGASGIEAEVEIIALAYNLMKSFGAKDEDFEIRVNNRAALSKSLADAGLDESQSKKMMRLIDRKDKISDFDEQAAAIAGDNFSLSAEEPAEVRELIEQLRALGIKNARYDENLVRGFDYYTGTVFEGFDTDPANPRALFGGGRYDNLMKDLFDEEGIPVVGFGMGDTVLIDFLKTRGLALPYRSATDLFIATVDSRVIPAAEKLAATWREQGLNVAVNLGDKKVGDQIKSADKQMIPYVVVLGEDELKAEKVTIKKLSDGSEQEVSFSEVVTAIKQ